MPPVRPELDGLRLYVPGRPEVWLIFHGLRHRIVSAQVYDALFIGPEGRTPVEGVDDIRLGPDLNEGSCLVRGDAEDEATYLVTGLPPSDVRKHHITSWDTFVRFGFAEGLVRITPGLAVSAIPFGRALRSPPPAA